MKSRTATSTPHTAPEPLWLEDRTEAYYCCRKRRRATPASRGANWKYGFCFERETDWAHTALNCDRHAAAGLILGFIYVAAHTRHSTVLLITHTHTHTHTHTQGLQTSDLTFRRCQPADTTSLLLALRNGCDTRHSIYSGPTLRGREKERETNRDTCVVQNERVYSFSRLWDRTRVVAGAVLILDRQQP